MILATSCSQRPVRSEVLQGSILRKVFNILISRRYIGDVFVIFTGDTKQGTPVDIFEGRAIIQRVLERLQEQVSRNLMKFSKGTCEVLCIGRKRCLQHLGLMVWRVALQKSELSARHQSTSAIEKATSFQEHGQQIQESYYPPLLHASCTTLKVLHPVLSCSVQETYKETGTRAEEGYAGYGLSLCEKMEGLGLVQPGEEMVLRISQQLPLLQGCSQEGRARLFTAVHGRRMRSS